MARIIGGALLLLGLGTGGCGKDEAPLEKVIRPVRYQVVYGAGGGRARRFSGAVRAGLEAQLSFKVPGTVRALRVKVGQKVDKGQVLAELDPSDYSLQVQQAQAGLAQARAQSRNSRAMYERTLQLYESRSVSKGELDAARAGSETAAAGAQAAEKQLALARRQLAYTRLTAPTGGSVAAVQVEVNENVNAGMPVVMLTGGARLEVEVAVPEVLIASVQPGGAVTIMVDALPGKSLKGRVSEVGVASVTGATTFPVTVRLDNPLPEVRPGMAAQVELTFDSGDGRERFWVPPYAVREDRNGRFVFVVKKTSEGLGVVERKDVEVGDLSSEGLEVFKGLVDGDLLVNAGVSRIQAGQEVKVLAH